MTGGSLAHFWPGYENYYTTDKLYADQTNGFIRAQTFMNLAENALNLSLAFGYLLLGFRGPRVLVFMVLALTLTWGKTVLYMIHEQTHSPHPTAHNTWQTYFLCYMLPNSFWLLCPIFGIFHIAKQLEKAVNGKGAADTKQKIK